MASQRHIRRKQCSPRETRCRTVLYPSKLLHQDGAFAVMFLPLLILIIIFCGFALDLGQLYNRKVDMSGIAKAAALAAARELNGTVAGVIAAKAKAKAAAESLRYQYFGSGNDVTWNDDALSFGTSPSTSGSWTPATTIDVGSSKDVSGLYFAKVDTTGLGAAIGSVDTFIMRIFSERLASIQIADSAVAGRAAVKVTPIGICAMGAKATERTYTAPGGGTLKELVQYGFRRGVNYDLMQLNPNGSNPVRFAINPVVSPGSGGSAFSVSALRPFLCSGTMWMPRVTGGSLWVAPLPATSPLASMDVALNSRFDVYTGGYCSPVGAPPDGNIKKFTYDQKDVLAWMNPTLGAPAAAKAESTSRLETVADPLTVPSSTQPGDYGPLWINAKAVKSPTPLDAPEPSGGYATFANTDWPTLYPSGPTSPNYPSTQPYQATSASTGYFEAPSTANKPMAIRGQRILNIPLLSCTSTSPSSANPEATVQAIAKFFMTVPATPDKLIAEFAGLVPEESLSGQVELYQ